MKVAIMQPTFLPWMGYFALLSSVEHFIFLDDVNYARRSWQSRNRIRTPQGELLISIPVTRESSSLLINQVKVASSYNHAKLLKQLSSNYKHTPYGKQCLEIVDSAFESSEGSLAAFNIGIITRIVKLCEFTTRLSVASEIPDISGIKAQRLYSICKSVNASQYLSPVGSLEYLQADNPFSKGDISLRFLNFQHPHYQQGDQNFIANLGIIDALSWLGPEPFSSLVKSSVGNARSIEEQSFLAIDKAA